MGHVKNTARSKRKYGDKRQQATARNKAAAKARHEAKDQRMLARADALVDAGVKAFIGKAHGAILEVVGRPEGSKRPGNYLLIKGPDGVKVKARARTKLVRSEQGR